MKQYLDAVRTILREGTRKESRTGVDTISTFGVHYNIDLRKGFPLLTTKKISIKNIVIENLWFLSGDPTIALLKKHGCKFWDAWADDHGRVPSAYGNFWRYFPTHERIGDSIPPTILPMFNDQIEWVLAELRRNPMSRRLVVSAWAPGNAQTSKLPPCHVTFVFNVQNLASSCVECSGSGVVTEDVRDHHGKYQGLTIDKRTIGNCPHCTLGKICTKTVPHLCLHLTQRSCDVALGVPYNIAGYAFLLELFAHMTGMKAGIFSHTLVDAHAYTCKPDGSMAEHDHIPGLKEQLTREPRPLPRLDIDPAIKTLDDIDRVLSWDTEDLLASFQLHDYNPHPAIPFKVAV